MPEGLFITRIEWNQLMKKVTYLEEYVKASANRIHKSKWMKPAAAMEVSRTLYKLPKLCELKPKGFKPVK